MKNKISKINFNNPHVFLILAALFWGFNAIAGRSAVGEISPLLIVTSRWLGVLILLTFICKDEILIEFKTFKLIFFFYRTVKTILKRIDLLGRLTTAHNFYIELYNDGTVGKNIVIR